MSGKKLTLSVIVPAHHEGEPFYRCLSSLKLLNPPPEEVLIVSDGAEDTIERAAQSFGFRCLQVASAGGPAKARNLGASQAIGDILFFVDSDVTVPADAVAQIQFAFAGDTEISAVIGSYDDAPAANNFLSQYKNLLHHYVHQLSHEEASTFWSGCGAIRSEVFRRFGGFDERYRRACIEDIELGYRMKKAGYRIRLLKMLQCKHLKKWGVLSLLKSDLFDRALPWTELIVRYRMLTNDLNLRLSNRISVALVFASILLLALGFFSSIFAWLALLSFAAMLGVNYPFSRFLYARRGLWFTMKSILWHLIYSLCCGLGFVGGVFVALPDVFRAALGKRAND